jgi:XRE family transcriptional regulator of biofilm formation
MVESLGEKVQRLRHRRGWSQRELARLARLSQPVVSALERGVRKDTTGRTLVRLAFALETSVDYLLGRMDHEPLP